MKSLRTAAVVCGAILVTAAAAWAAPASNADYIKARQTQYKTMGAAFKQAMDQLRQQPADLNVVRNSARVIVAMSQAQYGLFRAGSGPEAGVKTAAKPDIWTNAPAFKAAQDEFRARAGEFNLAAAGTDQAAITAAAQRLGQTCQKCHQQFRAKNP